MTAALRSFASILVYLLVAWTSSPAQAQEIAVRFDPAQTEIHWTLGAMLHSVHGTFTLVSGGLSFDPASGVARGKFVVDLASGNSGNDKRDRTMHEQVLESAKYPQASFAPTTLAAYSTSAGDQTVTTSGTFNIHGSDHQVQIKVNLQIAAPSVTATAHFTVPYVDWGMHDPSTFLLRVAKVVDVDVTAKGTVESQH